MKISVIVCSRTQADSDRIKAHYAQLFENRVWEFIGEVGAPSMAAGYNAGFAKSTGSVIIFSHDDVMFLKNNLWEVCGKYFELDDETDVMGLAGTNKLIGPAWISAGQNHVFGKVAHTNHKRRFGVCFYGPESIYWNDNKNRICAMDGLFLAARRWVCEAIPWDEKTFDGWHLYDLDFTYRAYLKDLGLTVPWELCCLHNSGGSRDITWVEAGRRFMEKHKDTIKPEPQPQFGFAWQYAENQAEALALMEGK